MKIIRKSITIITIFAIMLMLAMPMTAQAKAKTKLNKTTITMNVRKSYQLKVKGTSQKAKWTTSNKKVVAVNSKGKITAKKKGTAKITANVSGKRYTCKVTVKQPVTSVALNKKTATLTKKGATVSLKATAKPTNANNRKVAWKSSNTKVAKVSGKGVVTAVANGTATITATSADGSKKKATCKVTVKTSGDSGTTNTPTECQHNWVAVTKTIIKPMCSCGKIFNTSEELTEHALESEMNGDFSGHSCTTYEETVIDHYKCSKCGKTKSDECEHNWVAVTKTITKLTCNCGQTFTTLEESNAHILQKAMEGETNGHSTGISEETVIDHYECSICHKQKSAN